MIDVDEMSDEHEQRHDYPRANGAPLVMNAEGTKRERYSRPSSFGKPLDNEDALNWWRINHAMIGVARSPALAAKVMAAKDDDKVTFKELREQALDKGAANERADLGTALHAMTARVEDRRDTFEFPEQYAADLIAYLTMLDDFGLSSQLFEVPMVNDEHRAAGTADRVYQLTKPLITPDGMTLDVGTLIVGDLKTGQKLDFSAPGYCIQTALYATGVLYDVVTERRMPTPPINKDWTLLVHLPVGKGTCQLLWCSVGLGLYGAWLASEIKKWQKHWKAGAEGHDTPAVDLPVDVAFELGAEVIGKASLEEMNAWLHARVTTIAAEPDAKRWLILNWPEGVRTPKQGITETGDLIRVMHLLDDVEARFSLPFLHTDPRLALQQGTHRSVMDISPGRFL